MVVYPLNPLICLLSISKLVCFSGINYATILITPVCLRILPQEHQWTLAMLIQVLSDLCLKALEA